jgi:hypothetical protein
MSPSPSSLWCRINTHICPAFQDPRAPRVLKRSSLSFSLLIPHMPSQRYHPKLYHLACDWNFKTSASNRAIDHSGCQLLLFSGTIGSTSNGQSTINDRYYTIFGSNANSRRKRLTIIQLQLRHLLATIAMKMKHWNNKWQGIQNLTVCSYVVHIQSFLYAHTADELFSDIGHVHNVTRIQFNSEL